MKSYNAFHHDLNEAFKWNFLKKAFDWVKARIKSFVAKLGFGQTVKIPLTPPNMIMESLMCESSLRKCSGGPVQPILGNYGEWCTALHILKVMDKVNKTRMTFRYDKKQANTILKEKRRREKEISEMTKNAKNPKWNGIINYTDKKGNRITENVKEKYPDCWSDYLTSIASSWMDYDQKTELGAEGIVSILVDHMEDHEISTFDINMTGQGGGKGDEGTADLIISKMDKDKVLKEIKFSLKTYMYGIEGTKGTTVNGWFQALCDASGIKTPAGNQMALWMHPDVLSQIAKKYGKEMSDFVKSMSDLDRELYNAVPEHAMTAYIPEEKWDDPVALDEFYKKKRGQDYKNYGGVSGMKFRTVNEAIKNYPEIFVKPATYDKQGKEKTPEQIVSNPNFKKDYVNKVFGIGLNAIGSAGWGKVVETMCSTPETKRKLVDWVLNRMEVKKDEPFFVVTGTETSKTSGSKTHVLDIHKPSNELVSNWNSIIDSIDFRVKTNFKESEKFKDFKPTNAKAGHLLKDLEDATPKEYGGFYWELEIPGVKTFKWQWNMAAHSTGIAQLSVPGQEKQTMIDISGELTSKIAKKFGIDIHLEE